MIQGLKNKMKGNKLHKFTFYLLLCIILLTQDIYSQTADNDLEVPYLDTHQFMTNNFVKDPFLKTSVRNSLGMGKALDVEIPLVVIDGEELLALRGDILFLTLDFEYQHRVKDWLGVWARLLVLGRLGSGTEALISQGITAISGFDLGWLFKLHQTRKTQLSGSLGLTNTSSTIVNILDFVNGIIEGDFSSNNKLVRNIPSLRANSGLRYAWAMNDFFGTYLLGELNFGQSAVERNYGKLFYRFGGVLDFDLSTRTVLPFGVALGSVFSSLPRTGDLTKKNTQSFFLKIGYNTETNFIIGIETSLDVIPLESTGKSLKAGLTTINMQYFFH